MEQMLPMMVAFLGALLVIGLLGFALATPSLGKAQNRRLNGIKERYSGLSTPSELQMRKVIAARPVVQAGGNQLLPNKAALEKRLAMTGKVIPVKNYLLASLGILVIVGGLIIVKGAPWYLGVLVGAALGLAIPHFVIGVLIGKRGKEFTARFPDAIELMVRGLRSGLPISETLGIVAVELPGAVGDEFGIVTDKIRIGKTMDEALQEAADRLGSPEFNFFVITLAIQRETGGNLAETLSNLADVLRKRSQMKLKIRAMSSESKASAMILGALPFIVFAMIYMLNPQYIGGFFYEQRLIAAGLIAIVWMSIGIFIMAKMVNFEI